MIKITLGFLGFVGITIQLYSHFFCVYVNIDMGWSPAYAGKKPGLYLFIEFDLCSSFEVLIYICYICIPVMLQK